MQPELASFFALAGPWIRGEVTPEALRALGPTPSSDADLDFYPGLVRHGYHQALTDLFGPVRALVERWGGPAWDELCAAFLRAHPPTGHEIQPLGRPFAGWLESHLAGHGWCDGLGAPTAQVVAALADHADCKVRARYAPDGHDLGLEERLFVRRYVVDVVSLSAEPTAPGAGTTTVCTYRDHRDDVVRTFSPTVATMAVLASLVGAPRTGALALSDAELEVERDRLRRLGVIGAT